MNSFNFTGNLGGDAEVRYTQKGTAITNFSVASTSGWGDNKTTTWVRCVMWGDRGVKVAPLLTKGQQVAVSGEISLKEWEKDGVKRASLECKVIDLTLISKQRKESEPVAQKPVEDDDFDEDLPF